MCSSLRCTSRFCTVPETSLAILRETEMQILAQILSWCKTSAPPYPRLPAHTRIKCRGTDTYTHTHKHTKERNTTTHARAHKFCPICKPRVFSHTSKMQANGKHWITTISTSIANMTTRLKNTLKIRAACRHQRHQSPRLLYVT